MTIGDNEIWISADDTTDRCGRCRSHLISWREHRTFHLLRIVRREVEKVDHSSISRFINDYLRNLWPDNDTFYENTLMMLFRIWLELKNY